MAMLNNTKLRDLSILNSRLEKMAKTMFVVCMLTPLLFLVFDRTLLLGPYAIVCIAALQVCWFGLDTRYKLNAARMYDRVSCLEEIVQSAIKGNNEILSSLYDSEYPEQQLRECNIRLESIDQTIKALFRTE